jgi:glycosyltransferase involved in cell wall biosynthesis
MKINYSAPINSLSYGLVGLNVFLQLRKAGIDIAWLPIGGVEAPPEHHPALMEAINEDFDWSSPSLRLFHEFDLAQHIGNGRTYGWPIFEITNFTGQRLRHMKVQENIIVCSEWAKQVCRDNGLNQSIHVVPLGVNTDIFRPVAGLKEKNVLTFIHIGKREYRKSQLEMLQCFEKAFSPTDNVKLIMVWGSQLLQQRNPSEWQSWTNLYRRSKMTEKIELIEWVDSQQEVSRLLNSADVGLFLSKAEGFNLGCLESLACGLQNITLDYSGPTQFSSSKNSLLVEPTEYEDIQDGVWFTEKDLGTWAYFGQEQKDQTIDYMRNLYERKMNGDDLYNYEGVKTGQEYTWEATAERLLEVIS